MDERKLLIADDSELNRAILVSVLEKNFDILEAADGKEAIATLAAHEGNIAALLLDVVMPEADGFEVLEEMNRRGWIDEIPTIMISVETGGSYIDRAFQLGAADYVSRPFVPNMIRRRVINAILLHTKTQKLTGLIADHFYRRERNTDILAAILGYAVEFRSGERGTHMTKCQPHHGTAAAPPAGTDGPLPHRAGGYRDRLHRLEPARYRQAPHPRGHPDQAHRAHAG